MTVSFRTGASSAEAANGINAETISADSFAEKFGFAGMFPPSQLVRPRLCEAVSRMCRESVSALKGKDSHFIVGI